MLTHVIFGAGAVAALFPSFPADVRFLLAGASSVLMNFIDDLSQFMQGRQAL